MTARQLIAGILDGLELRSAPFIVTIYGDVVVPRGGVLWTGNLIETCERVGISETLVRTAVSRLVAADRLTGERFGRRSYYRLATAARREFDEAARLLYAADTATRGWQVLHAPALNPDDARRQRMGHMGGAVYIRPDRGQDVPSGALCLRAVDPAEGTRIGDFWDLSDLHSRYLDVLSRYRPVLQALNDGLDDEAALTARLLLVHSYRGVLLRDPRLPESALPADWKGSEARDMFRTLYQRLSPGAERWIASRFEGVDGFLPARTPQTEARRAGAT